MQTFVKKSQALANALQQQGRTAAAVKRLGNSISLLASLGITSHCLSPLVQSLVMTRTKLHDDGGHDKHAGAQLKPSGKAGSRCGSRQHQTACTLKCSVTVQFAFALGTSPIGSREGHSIISTFLV